MTGILSSISRILVLLALLGVVAGGGLVLFNLFSKPPPGLGVREGQLAECPSSPNCVSSQADPTDAVHYVKPFAVAAGGSEPIDRLAELIEATPRARVISRDQDYLHAEFTTPILRFVDDVEFYAPPGETVVHVRSASRIGYSDLGANRKRIEQLRDAF